MDDNTLKPILDLISDLTRLGNELVKWTKFAGMQQLRGILERNLTSDEMRIVYELSDGERTTRDIAKLSGIKSKVTITNYWSKWKSLGIVEPSPKFKGRYQRIVSLEDVGMTVPAPAVRSQSGAGMEPQQVASE